MLGSLHTSDVRRFIPRLLHIGDATLKKRRRGTHPQEPDTLVVDKTQPLYKLDWDSVDAYKRQEYLENRVRFEKRELPRAEPWVKGEGAPRNWSGKYHEEMTMDGPDYAYNDQVVVHESPPTLPAKYDERVKELTFTLPHNYKVEIEHFTKLFLMEHTRKRGFDTVVRDRCASTAASAIGNAFYLLSDCLYNQETEGWYRGPYKRVYQHLIAYKFWSGFTGRGLCFNHSGLDELQSTLGSILDKGDLQDVAKVYSEVIVAMRQYEEELAEFYKHTGIEEGPPVVEGEKSSTSNEPQT